MQSSDRTVPVVPVKGAFPCASYVPPAEIISCLLPPGRGEVLEPFKPHGRTCSDVPARPPAHLPIWLDPSSPKASSQSPLRILVSKPAHKHTSFSIFRETRGELSSRTGGAGQAAESLPQQVPVLAPLVVRGEARGVGGLGDLALGDLPEGVGTLAIGADAAHQMHLGWLVVGGGDGRSGGVWLVAGRGVATRVSVVFEALSGRGR